jgi:antirestriction protein ArdC
MYLRAGQEIVLANPEEAVFFHELAHASHDRIGELHKAHTWEKEIVAEFAAAALSLMVGKKMTMGNHAEYIKHYAENEGIT